MEKHSLKSSQKDSSWSLRSSDCIGQPLGFSALLRTPKQWEQERTKPLRLRLLVAVVSINLLPGFGTNI